MLDYKRLHTNDCLQTIAYKRLMTNDRLQRIGNKRLVTNDCLQTIDYKRVATRRWPSQRWYLSLPSPLSAKENTDLIPVTVWDVDDHFAEYLVVVEVCVLEPHFEIFHIPSHSNRHRNFHPEVVEVI